MNSMLDAPQGKLRRVTSLLWQLRITQLRMRATAQDYYGMLRVRGAVLFRGKLFHDDNTTSHRIVVASKDEYQCWVTPEVHPHCLHSTASSRQPNRWKCDMSQLGCLAFIA